MQEMSEMEMLCHWPVALRAYHSPLSQPGVVDLSGPNIATAVSVLLFLFLSIMQIVFVFGRKSRGLEWRCPFHVSVVSWAFHSEVLSLSQEPAETVQSETLLQYTAVFIFFLCTLARCLSISLTVSQ